MIDPIWTPLWAYTRGYTIRYRGVGRVCFLPPLFCPTKFVKSSDQFFERKARRRRKNFEVTFFKKLTFLGKFYGF